MDKVEVKQVIITSLLRRGKGVECDPVRIIKQIWDMEGNLICEIDPQFEQNGCRTDRQGTMNKCLDRL